MNDCFLPAVASFEAQRAKAKVITCCFWRRPKYTRMVLDALRACRGIENYTLLIQQDGADARGDVGQSEVRGLCERINFANARIVSESEHLGCNQNTRRALAAGFHHADYVIHVEDDILLAPDALQYFEWARQFGSDPRLFLASAWGYSGGWKPEKGGTKPPENDHTVALDCGLWIWGFATWRDRWEEMDRLWTGHYNDHVESWDMHLMNNVKRDRLCTQPFASRSYNIGEEGGTHRGAAHLSYWAGSPTFAKRRNPRLRIEW